MHHKVELTDFVVHLSLFLYLRFCVGLPWQSQLLAFCYVAG